MKQASSNTPSQWTLFLTAVQFYTRIPLPKSFQFRQEALASCNRYLPLVGYLVAGLNAFVFYLFMHWLPQTVSVIASVGAGVWLTGAFHEDGLADFCDGFGGGWDKERILSIMKDSRLGTFGAVALFLVVGLKCSILASMPEAFVIPSLFIGHSLSRLFALRFMAVMPYVRPKGKAKNLTGDMSLGDQLIALLLALTPLVGFLFFLHASGSRQSHLLMFVTVLAIALLGLHTYLRRLMYRWIQGYTGDCLGAGQQLSEVLTLMIVLGSFG